jgi:hypothetical protein
VEIQSLAESPVPKHVEIVEMTQTPSTPIKAEVEKQEPIIEQTIESPEPVANKVGDEDEPETQNTTSTTEK